MRLILLFISFLLLTLLAGFIVSQHTSYLLILSIVAIALFIASFVNPGLGLYILIFSMLLSPEFDAGRTYGSSLGRGVTLRIEDVLLMVIGASWFFRSALDKESGLFLKTPLNKPILFYGVVCILATGFGIMGGRINPKTGFFYLLKYLEYFIIFYMVISYVKDEKQIKRFVFFIFLTCVIVSAIGMHQIPTGQRVTAPFEGETGEPNTFGGYLVFILAIALGLMYWLDSFKIKQLLIVLIIIIIPPFLYTESRSSYLALISMIFIFSMMMKKRMIVIGVALAMLIISPLFLPAAVKDRVMFTFNQPEEPGQVRIGDVRLDTSLSARLIGWSGAITSFPEHPLLGFGITGFGFVDAQFPRVLIETGIIGVMAFILLMVSILKMAISHYQQVTTRFAKGICMGYIAGFIGLMFHALGANTFIIVRIMEPFWFFTGIVFLLPMVETGRPEPEIQKAIVPWVRNRFR